MSMGDMMMPVVSSTIPRRREGRLEAKWLPWREECAAARAALVYARAEEAHAHPSRLLALRAVRKSCEKRYKKLVRRGNWMLLRDLLAAPFGHLKDAFDDWMNSPDMQRQ